MLWLLSALVGHSGGLGLLRLGINLKNVYFSLVSVIVLTYMTEFKAVPPALSANTLPPPPLLALLLIDCWGKIADLPRALRSAHWHLCLLSPLTLWARRKQLPPPSPRGQTGPGRMGRSS